MGRLFVEDINIHIEKPKLGQKVSFGIACPEGAYIIGFAGDVGESVVSIAGGFFIYTHEGVEYPLLPAAATERTGQFFSRWVPTSQEIGEVIVPPARLTRAVETGFLPSRENAYLHIVSTDGQPITAVIWIAY